MNQAHPQEAQYVASGLVLASYAAMNFAKHSFWGFFSLFALIYLTDSVGMAPEAAGALLFASLLFDAAVDVPAGAVLDQIRSRLKTYGPVIAFSALSCAVTFWAFFSVSALHNGSNPIVLLIGSLLAFRIAFTIFDLSDNVLASRVTQDAHQRTILSAARKVAAALATLILGFATNWLLDGNETADRFLVFASLLGAVTAVLIPLAYWPLRRADADAPPMQIQPYRVRWRALRQSPDAWMLTSVTILEAASTPILIGGLAYFSKSAFGSSAWAGAAIVALTVAQIVSLPLWLWVAKRSGKRVALQIAHALAALFAGLLAVLGTADGGALHALVFGFGVAMGGISTLRWSLAPDIIDRSESQSGVRVEGGILSLLTASIQVGAGLAAGALGFGLARLGYAPDAPPPASLLASWIAAPPAIAHAACVYLLARWRFTESGGSLLTEPT